MNNQYLLKLRNGEKLSTSQQVKMILLLSLPAILSQVSSTVMQYIDASMVGSLGLMRQQVLAWSLRQLGCLAE